MDMQDLYSAKLVWKAHFNVDVKTSWAKNGFVDKIFSVCHADNQDVVKSLDSLNVRQELVDHKIRSV